ncbi:MAG: hypothetical protein KBA23_00705 [Amaricoccus sp.]|nr:hypothetical protein [Amaricoccus sp.]
MFFQGSALSGALFAAGLLVASRRACATALAPLGMPAMTLPFVLTTRIFLLAGRGFSTIWEA